MGRALRHRNYRLFFAGQGTSLIGTWLTRVATSWLVYRLTHSALLLGIVGFASQMPTFLLAPVAGVLIDRWNRHRVLVVTQVLAMVQSGLLAVFSLTGTITVWHVLVLGAFQGLINAFDTPARQSFVVEMVESRDDLPNAIALNSSMVNAARLIGPSIGGVLIAAVGEGWCFAADAASYVAVIASLLAMRISPRPARARAARVLVELRDGLRYVASVVPIRSVLLLLAFVSFTGIPYMVLMPIFAGQVLHGGPHTLGLLTASSGAGAVTGALWLASRRGALGLPRVICLAGATFGAGLVAFGLSRSVWVSAPLMVRHRRRDDGPDGREQHAAADARRRRQARPGHGLLHDGVLRDDAPREPHRRRARGAGSERPRPSRGAASRRSPPCSSTRASSRSFDEGAPE